MANQLLCVLFYVLSNFLNLQSFLFLDKTIVQGRIRKIVEEHCQLYVDSLYNDLEIIERKITYVKKYLRLIRDHVKSNLSSLNTIQVSSMEIEETRDIY